MQVKIVTSPVPLLLFLIFFPYTLQGQTSDSEPEVHPPWVYDERLLFKLLGVQSLTILGGIPSDKANWQLWKKNINQLPFSQDIRKVFLNGHFVTADEMEYFCGFENVEILNIGSSIEGVTISPESLGALSKLTKLQEITISVHGLSDRHLEVLESLPNLTFLQIEFPSKNMLSDPDQFSAWRPAELSDSSLKRISKLKNLKVFSFHPPGPGDGMVTFSSQGLLSLLDAPKLERLQIHYDGLSDIFLKSVSNLKKLEYVSLTSNSLTDAGLEETKGVSIEEFRLQSDQFTDKALIGLKEFSLVKSLAIESPLFSHAGAIELLKTRGFGDTTVILDEHVIRSFVR